MAGQEEAAVSGMRCLKNVFYYNRSPQDHHQPRRAGLLVARDDPEHGRRAASSWCELPESVFCFSISALQRAHHHHTNECDDDVGCCLLVCYQHLSTHPEYYAWWGSKRVSGGGGLRGKT